MPDTARLEVQLDATVRALELIWEVGGDVSVQQVLSRHLPAAAEQIWSALTCPGRLAQWYTPVSGDLRGHGRFELEHIASGRILECAQPHRLVLTWEHDGVVDDVLVEVVPEGDGCRVRLLHAAVIARESWVRFGPGADGVSWDLALLSLQRHLEGAATGAPECAVWFATEQAEVLVTAASRRWADASIEAGTPDEEARAAAERTTAYYLSHGA